MKTFWIDMDGVLATYRRNDYKCADPKFLHLGEHYFRSLKPVEKMVKAISNLDIECKKSGKARVIILTGIHYVNDALMLEHLNDKIEWVKEYLPSFDINTQFLASTTDKGRSAIIFKKGPITADDILIDDFNKNLIAWEEHDGTAIKFLNGTNNSKTFTGEKLHRRFTSDECYDYLMAIANSDTPFADEETSEEVTCVEEK